MPVQQLLLQTLEGLRQADFKRLKWFLMADTLEGCKPIPVARLERATRMDTVSRMIESYGEHLAVSIIVEILEKMSNSTAAERLQKTYTEEAAAQEKVSHSLVTSSSPLGLPTEGAAAQEKVSCAGVTSSSWSAVDLPTDQKISTDGAAGAIVPSAPNACYREGAAAQEKVSLAVGTSSSSALCLPTGRRSFIDGAAGAIAPIPSNGTMIISGNVRGNIGHHSGNMIISGNVCGNIGCNAGGIVGNNNVFVTSPAVYHHHFYN
ncbi:uncharacterized protein LOC126390191 isoform X2 [Epinephelus moara]|uniref:uncharacterized protein LOC126390191 isoform X2 n=1 Tax=Epinephelus moara TaxID=300413 RepID=UPI00214F1918|nr:uncharacterized protein LOC126390191 isoform X2 [Epinephelus moara]